MCNKTVLEIIKESKEEHILKLDTIGKKIKDHIEKYGINICDWLIWKRQNENYHRGAYDALNDLEREIRGMN